MGNLPKQNILEAYSLVYKEMRQRNRSELSAGNIRFDSYLNNTELDNRLGWDLFCFFSTNLNTTFARMVQEAEEQFKDQVVYTTRPNKKKNQGLLHFTPLQLIRVGEANVRLEAEQENKYIDILYPVISSIPTFSIQYSGLIAIPTGLAMYGYPNVDINIYRDKIRSAIQKAGLPFDEPFLMNITHSTFVRLSTKENSQKLLDFAEKYKDIDLGTVMFDKMYLEYGSWRMWPEERIRVAEFDLANQEV